MHQAITWDTTEVLSNETHKNRQWNLDWNTKKIIQEHAFENAIMEKMPSLLTLLIRCGEAMHICGQTFINLNNDMPHVRRQSIIKTNVEIWLTVKM